MLSVASVPSTGLMEDCMPESGSVPPLSHTGQRCVLCTSSMISLMFIVETAVYEKCGIQKVAWGLWLVHCDYLEPRWISSHQRRLFVSIFVCEANLEVLMLFVSLWQHWKLITWMTQMTEWPSDPSDRVTEWPSDWVTADDRLYGIFKSLLDLEQKRHIFFPHKIRFKSASFKTLRVSLN